MLALLDRKVNTQFLLLQLQPLSMDKVKIISLKLRELNFTVKPISTITASILGITQLLGSFITPPIMERYGRKVAHFSATVPNLVGWFIITMATNFEVNILFY